MMIFLVSFVLWVNLKIHMPLPASQRMGVNMIDLPRSYNETHKSFMCHKRGSAIYVLALAIAFFCLI